MADDSLNITIPFQFEIKCPPKGMTDYDIQSISTTQQLLLNDMKMDVRRENETYLADHPEIKAIVTMFMRAAINQHPRDVKKYSASFFSQPYNELKKTMLKIMAEPDFEREGIPYETYASFDY